MVQSLLRVNAPLFVEAAQSHSFLSLLLLVGLFVVGAAVVINGAADVVCNRLLVAFVVVDSGVDVVCSLHFTPNFTLLLFTALQVPLNGASVHMLGDKHVFHVGDP